MKNVAGNKRIDEVDALLREELRLARIPIVVLPAPQQGEVRTTTQGELHGWMFRRLWCYWSAVNEREPLPFALADPLHAHIGKEVRVDGNCTCPDPHYYERCGQRGSTGVPRYHIDSQLGLYLLADAIKQCVFEKTHPDECRECGAPRVR